ncbi:MAG: hypothetical protein IPH82_11840 [Chloroflexi bacterium]|nr:hypothetical protein [Chloroflexota bacterium]
MQHNNAALGLGVLAEQRQDIANAGVDIVWGQVDEMVETAVISSARLVACRFEPTAARLNGSLGSKAGFDV